MTLEFFRRVRRPEREADHPRPFSTEDKLSGHICLQLIIFLTSELNRVYKKEVYILVNCVTFKAFKHIFFKKKSVAYDITILSLRSFVCCLL
jgi:hypothetical protein